MSGKVASWCWMPKTTHWPHTAGGLGFDLHNDERCPGLAMVGQCNTCKDTGRVMWRIDSGPDAGMRQWGDCPDCKEA